MWAVAAGEGWFDLVLKAWPMLAALGAGAWWVIRDKSREKTREKVNDKEQVAITRSVSTLEGTVADVVKQQTQQQEHNKQFVIKLQEICLAAEKSEARLLSEIREQRAEINRNSGTLERIKGRLSRNDLNE